MEKKYKVVEEIRLDNTRTISARIGVEALRERLGISRQRLHQLIGKNPARIIGSELARRIEQVNRYPRGWLDHEHLEDESDFAKLMAYADTVPPERFKRLYEMIRAFIALANANRSEQHKNAPSSASDNAAPPNSPTLDDRQEYEEPREDEGTNGNDPPLSARSDSAPTKRRARQR